MRAPRKKFIQTQAEYIYPPADLIEQTKAGVELWRAVVGSHGEYEVSNFGAVRSYKRGVLRTLTPYPQPVGGYLVVTLRINGGQRCTPIHCLMAEAFIGPRPGSYRLWQASHADDVRTHNTLDNIRWATAMAQANDQRRNGGTRSRVRPTQTIDGVLHYRCTRCESWKTEANFGRIRGKNARASLCGILPECRRCSTERRRELRRRAKTK